MESSQYILGDWGTTRLRLYLYDDRDSRAPLRTSEGPGVKETSDFEDAFRKAAAGLAPQGSNIPVFFTGMIGSNIGWRQTPYIPCPASHEDFFDKAAVFSFDQYTVHILPGAVCANRFGYRDIMRGEETQISGALARSSSFSNARLFCLPGTHVKWALVKDARLHDFETSMQGELFEIINNHSILTRKARQAPPSQPNLAAFARGAELFRTHKELSISQALFATRSYEIFGELPPSDAPSFVSGVMIGADIKDIAIRKLAEYKLTDPVILVGDGRLTELYAYALNIWNIASQKLDGEEAVIAGLQRFRAYKNRRRR